MSSLPSCQRCKGPTAAAAANVEAAEEEVFLSTNSFFPEHEYFVGHGTATATASATAASTSGHLSLVTAPSSEFDEDDDDGGSGGSEGAASAAVNPSTAALLLSEASNQDLAFEWSMLCQDCTDCWSGSGNTQNLLLCPLLSWDKYV